MRPERRILRRAHQHSIRHREEILASKQCGCFFCCAIFTPQEIEEWVDDEPDGPEVTALCPKCGIDSVIDDQSGFPITADFLNRMKRWWFNH
jgi:hypothetical protein